MSNYTNDLEYSDKYIREILEKTNSIAVVGISANWNRPSYFAAKYLQMKGYQIIPINPKEKGNIILGELVYSSIEELNFIPDMVDIFRKSEAAYDIVTQSIKIGASIVWMQLGVRDDFAAAIAKKNNIDVIMDRCPKIEYARLTGELGIGGINTKIITSKKRMLQRGTK